MIKKALPAVALALMLAGIAAAPAQAGEPDPMSPQLSLIENNLNRPCIAIPIKANIQQLIGLINIIAVQDIPILSAPQNQQCTDNATQAKGDEPLSHILDQIPVLSSNGVNNG